MNIKRWIMSIIVLGIIGALLLASFNVPNSRTNRAIGYPIATDTPTDTVTPTPTRTPTPTVTPTITPTPNGYNGDPAELPGWFSNGFQWVEVGDSYYYDHPNEIIVYAGVSCAVNKLGGVAWWTNLPYWPTPDDLLYVFIYTGHGGTPSNFGVASLTLTFSQHQPYNAQVVTFTMSQLGFHQWDVTWDYWVYISFQFSGSHGWDIWYTYPCRNFTYLPKLPR